MFNLFKKTELTLSEKEVIEMIHADFDSAEDRLLNEAKEMLLSLTIKSVESYEDKAERLRKLGFKKSEPVKQLIKTLHERSEQEKVISLTKSQADLIQYYKQTYPFQKFLTIEELNRICGKYGLIYAPVENYINDVPDKNILDIENAPKLKEEDISPNVYKLKILKFWDGVPSEIKKMLAEEVIYDGAIFHTSTGNLEILDTQLLDYLIDKGYTGDYRRYIFGIKGARLTEENREGLFICAPKNHFDLANLKFDKNLGYSKVKYHVLNDPIVFRYVRGGIQVITKWGLEASDESLLNPINN